LHELLSALDKEGDGEGRKLYPVSRWRFIGLSVERNNLIRLTENTELAGLEQEVRVSVGWEIDLVQRFDLSLELDGDVET
jgi:hypothetical protein